MDSQPWDQIPGNGVGMKWISLIMVLLFACADVVAQDKFPLLNIARKPVQFENPGDQVRAVIEPGSVMLDFSEMSALAGVRRGGRIRLPSLDNFTDNQDEPLEFERVDLFAPGARILVISEFGTVQIEPPLLHYFLATNSTTGIGLAVDPVTGATSGYAIKGGAELKVSGELSGTLEFTELETTDAGSKECGTVMGDQPLENIAFLDDGFAPSLSAATAGSTLDFEAVIAIDTDTEWLAGFNNNTAAASGWIANLFLAMNVMFERDIATRLLLGDVILRTGSDPYTVTNGNRGQQLDEFGEFWRVNQGGIDRDFAAMFSGRNISANAFSGIAWINQYCQNGWVSGSRTVGSYSYNAIGSDWSENIAAKFVGHELGHNMGSPHTHCYTPTVDQCYGGESGCYSGSALCPVSGAGTTMSYCHLNSGCGSTADFHPTVQALFGDRLAANSPSCIAPYPGPEPETEAPLFISGFE